MRSKGESGQYLATNPPYGYKKDPQQPKKWIIDTDAAVVVKRFYTLCLEGYGPSQIARILKDDKVLTPAAYWHSVGRGGNRSEPENLYRWFSDTVAAILARQEYLGHMVNFKTHKQSYKSKKKLDNPPEEWVVFENVHESIIEYSVWEKVQVLRKNKRRPTSTGKTNMFSGVAYCSDCGSKLYYCTCNQFESRQDHFVCSASRNKGKSVCTTHFIRAVVLETLVLKHLQYVTSFVSRYEDSFRETLHVKQEEETKKETASQRKRIVQAQRRINELSVLFKRMYEDNVTGKLSDAKFAELSADYEKEQEELNQKLIKWKADLVERKEHADNVDRFIRICRKYVGMKELTPMILNELVQKVYVEAPDKSSGKRRQNIHICYDLVGILPALITPTNEKTA